MWYPSVSHDHRDSAKGRQRGMHQTSSAGCVVWLPSYRLGQGLPLRDCRSPAAAPFTA